MHEGQQAAYDALEKALKTPDLPVGYSIPTGKFIVGGNLPMDFPKFSSVYADEYGRLWREDWGGKIVLVGSISTGD